jgi:hypothetical protein
MHNDPHYFDAELVFYCLACSASSSFYLTQIAPYLGV